MAFGPAFLDCLVGALVVTSQTWIASVVPLLTTTLGHTEWAGIWARKKH